MDTRDLILSALAAGGENTIYSPVQVQKLLFLIDREAAPLVGGQHFDFKPYNYGPFDRAVYDQLDGLAQEGLIEIHSSGRYPKYTLTSEWLPTRSRRAGQAPTRRKIVPDESGALDQYR